METKQLMLKEVKSLIDKNEDDEKLSRFLGFLLFQSIISLICYTSFFILSLVLVDNVSKLAIVSPKLYLTLTAILVGVSLVITASLSVLYFHKRWYQKNRLKKAKVLYSTYQVYDIINFVFEMLVVLYFVIMFIVTPAKVSGDSMENTYHDGDTVLVWHLYYKPEIDDVVIIDTENGKYGTRNDTDFIIKRVVAVGGSKVTYQNGFLVVNDVIVEALSELEYHNLFIDSKTQKNYYNENEIIISQGYLLVLGDNREASYDSSEFGLVNEEDVLGKSFIRLYPNFGMPDKNIR